jgi:hypothetical protein
MSVDTVNYALTKVRRAIQDIPDCFTEAGHNLLIAVCGCMREELMREDIAGFDKYVDSILAREPDAADYVLEELFAHLEIRTREELTIKLQE